ncbi:dihydrofolate reductase family protein [Micromonosporaceae bacterium Da 78-11]
MASSAVAHNLRSLGPDGDFDTDGFTVAGLGVADFDDGLTEDCVGFAVDLAVVLGLADVGADVGVGVGSTVAVTGSAGRMSAASVGVDPATTVVVPDDPATGASLPQAVGAVSESASKPTDTGRRRFTGVHVSGSKALDQHFPGYVFSSGTTNQSCATVDLPGGPFVQQTSGRRTSRPPDRRVSGMRKLIVIEFLTLDGVMQGLGSPDEDRDNGFPHGGWAGPYFDTVQAEAATGGLASTSAYLFGRRTYDTMVGFWPQQPDDNPMAAHLNATTKYVATRTRTELTWSHAHVLDGGLTAAVTALKAHGDGSIAVLGSGVLVQQLLANGLVDGFRLFLHPLLLGTGKRLFRELAHPQRLRLVDCTPTSTGVLMLGYDLVD